MDPRELFHRANKTHNLKENAMIDIGPRTLALSFSWSRKLHYFCFQKAGKITSHSISLTTQITLSALFLSISLNSKICFLFQPLSFLQKTEENLVDYVEENLCFFSSLSLSLSLSSLIQSLPHGCKKYRYNSIKKLREKINFMHLPNIDH